MNEALWMSTRLGDVAEVLSGFAFSSTGFSELGGLPLVRIRDIDSDTTEVNFVGGFDPRFVVDHGAILIGMDGEFHVRRWRGPRALLNQRVCRVFSRPGKANDSFLFWRLRPLVDEIHSRTPQTTVRHLAASDVTETSVSLPPLPEQRAIAAVLDTIDDAIQKTEQIIAKLQQVKQGLLHDLLTRGIDDNGELRDPERHPEQFQDSPLGRIPKGWGVRSLEDCTRTDAPITYGIVQAGPHIEGGVPYIRTGDMAGDELVREGMLCTSPRIAASFARSRVEAGDIVCAIRATVGKVLPVSQQLEGANLTQGTARIAPARDIHPSFLLWALRGFCTKRQFDLYTKGTTFSEITLTQLRKLLVAVPLNGDEQVRVAQIMESWFWRLARERENHVKLIACRAGLSDDLLTGRVRTTSLPGVAA